MGHQVHIPLHRPQLRQQARCETLLQVPSGLCSPTQSQAAVPFPSGYILRGRRIDRSDLGRPAVPPTLQAHTTSSGRSRRRSPGGPSTQSDPFVRACSGTRPPDGSPQHPQQPSRQRESRARPVSRFRGVKGRPVSPPRARPPQASRTTANPPKTGTLGGLVLYPPCSRKGPLLATCRLKSPRRVKRETTNSRFWWTLGTRWFSVGSPRARRMPRSTGDLP